eukprot:gnl/MRDRNA2_/MRDRNA2_77476_c0_seq2.p1 gnl/MRDRNA2_/MRDRNA2_77476_c0~~gnl/MRDRNA2_/MRDRNA2_77476_c0_seq2.p1  ORF type:complete len:128 (-),score=13.71 gnl/MRDRNA2_/MRDRNA2_77476_c0_seq2:154-537(-)
MLSSLQNFITPCMCVNDVSNDVICCDDSRLKDDTTFTIKDDVDADLVRLDARTRVGSGDKVGSRKEWKSSSAAPHGLGCGERTPLLVNDVNVVTHMPDSTVSSPVCPRGVTANRNRRLRPAGIRWPK